MRFSTLVTAAAVLLSRPAVASSDQTPEYYNSAAHPAADPYVFYDYQSGKYYAYSTEGSDKGYNFAIYSSPDLDTWHKHPGGALKACRDDDGNRMEGGQACWAKDWFWAPETYYNDKTGWYFMFFAGRMDKDGAKNYFRYSEFEEPSKLGVAVSRSPTGPFKEIEPKPIEYYPFDPGYHDVNLIMDKEQKLPPTTQEEAKRAPKGTFIPTIDVNVFFDDDEKVYLYCSRNAYRNWNWDDKLGKYIEESNIIMVEMERGWWDDAEASTMPQIARSQQNIHGKNAPELPSNITSYNGTGEIGNPPRKDGWKTVISYGADPQDWENAHVDDYNKTDGKDKNRRWAEGSTLLKRTGKDGKPVYLLTYSANNYESANYGVGFTTAESPFGPFRKSSNNPVLAQEPDAKIPVYSVGHGSVVASPPKNKWDQVGNLDVTHKTPDGAELFYIHHGRNNTKSDRSLYTTRMLLDESNVYFKSNDAISMNLTTQDQPLPAHSYPLQMEATCPHIDGDQAFRVRVISRNGAPFDLIESFNRVVTHPDSKPAKSVKPDKREGSFILKFDNNKTDEFAYQRLNSDGKWSTVFTKQVFC